MKNILRKKFSLRDNIVFSKLSGDKNPIHLDKKVNYYSQFEKPVVQGVQVLKYLFESNFLKKILDRTISISIIFKNPIFINEIINFKIKKEKNNLLLVGQNSFQKKIIITIELLNENGKKNEVNYKDLIKNLISLTKDIGNFKKNLNIISTIHVSVDKKNLKKKISKLTKNFFRYKYSHKMIELEAFFVSFEKKYEENIELKSKIKPNKKFFNNKKILIIGGSSGLGRVLVSFFLSNKIICDFTYFKNIKSVKSLKRKFKINKSQILQMNHINFKKYKNRLKKYQIIYFFPTPKIFNFSEKVFNYKKFNEFNKINILFTYNIIKEISNFYKKVYLYVPSTKLIFNMRENPEYSMSKSLQEKFLSNIKRSFRNLKIINPRLDSYLTKSTKGLINNKSSYDKFLKSAINL